MVREVCAHKYADADGDGRKEHMFVLYQRNNNKGSSTFQLWIANDKKGRYAKKHTTSTVKWRGRIYKKIAGTLLHLKYTICSGKYENKKPTIDITNLQCDSTGTEDANRSSCPPPIIHVRGANSLNHHQLMYRNRTQYNHQFLSYQNDRVFQLMDGKPIIGSLQLSKNRTMLSIEKTQCLEKSSFGQHGKLKNDGVAKVKTARIRWDRFRKDLAKYTQSELNERARCDIYDYGSSSDEHGLYNCGRRHHYKGEKIELKKRDFCERYQFDLNGDGVIDTVQVHADRTITINNTKTHIGLCSKRSGCSPNNPRYAEDEGIDTIGDPEIVGVVDLPKCGGKRPTQALILATQEYGYEEAPLRYIFLGYQNGKIRILFGGDPRYDLSEDIVQRAYASRGRVRFNSGYCAKEASNYETKDGIWEHYTNDFRWSCKKRDFVRSSHRTTRTRSDCMNAACPYVVVGGHDIGEILRNLDNPEKEAEQTLQLPLADLNDAKNQTGALSIMLEERKAETTFLDAIWLEVDGQKILPTMCITSPMPSWCVADGTRHRIEQNESLKVIFSISNEHLTKTSQKGGITLHATGYYIRH